jgi:hypothetical protein
MSYSYDATGLSVKLVCLWQQHMGGSRVGDLWTGLHLPLQPADQEVLGRNRRRLT